MGGVGGAIRRWKKSVHSGKRRNKEKKGTTASSIEKANSGKKKKGMPYSRPKRAKNEIGRGRGAREGKKGSKTEKQSKMKNWEGVAAYL